MAEVVVKPLGGLITLQKSQHSQSCLQWLIQSAALRTQFWWSKAAQGCCVQWQYVVKQHFTVCCTSGLRSFPHVMFLVFLYVFAETLAIGGLGQLLSNPCWGLRETEPLRAMTCAVLLHACALLYGFNYRLWTQTDLFILLHSIHWGLVGTTNTRATHTQTHALTHCFVVVKSIYSEQVVPASWVTHLCFMSNNSVICGYLSAGHHRKQALKCSSFHHCMTNCSHLFLLFRL